MIPRIQGLHVALVLALLCIMGYSVWRGVSDPRVAMESNR